MSLLRGASTLLLFVALLAVPSLADGSSPDAAERPRSARQVAKRFLAAVDAEDAARARRWASRAVVARAIAETSSAPGMRLGPCGSLPGPAAGERACSSTFVSGPEEGTQALGLLLRRSDRGAWRVVEALRAE